MNFTYKAKKLTGEEISGEREARDRFELSEKLKKQGYILISYKEKKNESATGILFNFFNRVKISEKIIFAKNLSVMIDAGLAAARSLSILSRQTKNPYLKKVIGSLEEDISRGNPLSKAMKKFPEVFSPLFSAMVRMGEESGRLSEALKIIGIQLDRDWTIKKKMRGAMIYPVIVIIALIIIGILMLVFVVPTLVSTFAEIGMELPLSTRIIISLSNFLTTHAIFSLLLLVFFSIAGTWFSKKPIIKKWIGAALFHLPIISPLIKKVNAARTTRSLASLTGSGVKIIEALEITRDILQNPYYKEVIEKAKEEIQKGAPISKSFLRAEKLYPVLVGEMIAVGEETGKLTEMLERVANFYEDEVADITKNLSTIVEPVLMLLVGAIVGFFAISMITPMYSMVSGI